MFNLLVFIAILLAGAAFGFFFAWSFTVMRGFDAIEPRAAIAAMQGVNANIQTVWFALVFFGTPLAAAAAAAVAFAGGRTAAGACLAGAAVVYAVAVFGLTFALHVPMNDALARVDAATADDPAAVWTAYSGRWTAWNHLRTAGCGAALLLAALALRLARI